MRSLFLTMASFATLLSTSSCTKADQPTQTSVPAAAQVPTKSGNVLQSPQALAQQAQPSWFIESYNNGVITAQHDGHTYSATCVETSSYTKDFSDVTRSPKCTLSIELVGHEVKAFGAEVNPDADGRTIVALTVGERLVFRMSHGEGSGVRDEEFKINSVTRSPR